MQLLQEREKMVHCGTVAGIETFAKRDWNYSILEIMEKGKWEMKKQTGHNLNEVMMKEKGHYLGF